MYIVVIYVGTQGMNAQEVHKTFKDLQNAHHKVANNEIQHCFVPDPTTKRTVVKCINPQYVSDEDKHELEKLKEAMKKVQAFVDEATQNNNDEKAH